MLTYVNVCVAHVPQSEETVEVDVKSEVYVRVKD